MITLNKSEKIPVQLQDKIKSEEPKYAFPLLVPRTQVSEFRNRFAYPYQKKQQLTHVQLFAMRDIVDLDHSEFQCSLVLSTCFLFATQPKNVPLNIEYRLFILISKDILAVKPRQIVETNVVIHYKRLGDYIKQLITPVSDLNDEEQKERISKRLEEHDNECNICLESIDLKDMAVINKCGHEGHIKCLKKVIVGPVMHRKCPMCRQPIQLYK